MGINGANFVARVLLIRYKRWVFMVHTMSVVVNLPCMWYCGV